MTLKRRNFIQKIGLTIPLITPPFNKLFAFGRQFPQSENEAVNIVFKQDFKGIADRTWIGESFWSIPLEDWQIKKGRLEFTGSEKRSRLNLLTHTLTEGDGSFTIKGELGLLEKKQNRGSVGFGVGIKDTVTDADNIRSACYYGKGVSAGVSAAGELFINAKRAALPSSFRLDHFTLLLTGSVKNNRCALKLTATDDRNNTAFIEHDVEDAMNGIVAMENNIDSNNGDTFWWKNIELSGNKVKHEPENSFGPILWCMYTLSGKKVKLMAQMAPVGEKDNQQVELQLRKNGKWVKTDVQTIAPEAYTVHFALDHWDNTVEIPYRIKYSIQNKESYYEGLIRKEPLDRPLKFGGLTCQQWGGYPYSPLVRNLERHNPDILYFSGDQLYEENGGYPIKRQPEDKAILNYLGKWYMFGWVFGNIMKDRPTICTPDDHDVFQGNLWGEGGEGISFDDWEKVKDAHGGFVQTPKMVNVVNLTQCGHLPDPYQKELLPSGMTTWFTELVYGKVSFAIVSDRIFKSGPEMIREGKGRIDHITNPLSPEELESDKLDFLGTSQMQFLNSWIENWKESSMKVLLSQTLFANVGTHHGPDKMFLYGDMDSGGWPRQRRDEVIKTIRKASAFHINGDQHVPFLVQYGVNEAQDAGWTFCTPAISTGYPRWGEPDSVKVPFSNRPTHNLSNTGCYKDVFGNDNFIYAVGNPDDSFNTEMNRYIRAQKKSSGFGIITFDTDQRTIGMEAFRFLADKNHPKPDDQFPGWPLTITQSDNDGRKPIGYLPKLSFSESDQVIKILKEDSQELIKTMRVKGNEFTPAVYEEGKYTLIIGEGKLARSIQGVEISKQEGKIIKV